MFLSDIRVLSDIRAAVGFYLLSPLHHLLGQIASVSILEEWREAFETGYCVSKGTDRGGPGDMPGSVRWT